MVCPRLHFKRINYCKDNFCQIRKTVNLIFTKFLYFFDSQNNVIMKSDFLKFCFTCSSQNLILAKSKKICDFSFAKSLNFFAAKIHAQNPPNSLLWITPSLTPVFPLPSPSPSPTLRTTRSKLHDGLPIFDFFVVIFFLNARETFSVV